VYDVANGSYTPLARPENLLLLKEQKGGQPEHGATLYDMGDGVAELEIPHQR